MAFSVTRNLAVCSGSYSYTASMNTMVSRWLLLLCTIGSLNGWAHGAQDVPQPKVLGIYLPVNDGYRIAFSNTWRIASDAFPEQASVLQQHLQKLGVETAGEDSSPTYELLFQKDPSLDPEAYKIDRLHPLNPFKIEVSASTPTGAAHACASLLLAALSRDRKPDVGSWEMHIEDAPDLPYRGFMVDLGRNPHSPETLRHVVDALWLLKVNILHLHLIDDQLSSWPSKAFPKLADPRSGWTWEDWLELERYARARGVTLVPELEAPGHSSLLRRHYPEVFGETTTDLATLPEARKGLQTLIDEMLSVFTSAPYFHIGADEAYGVPEDAQRALINDLNRFLKERGKRTLVWEGPRPGSGEGAVDPDVIHMAWRCTEFPAQAMLDAGHQVINASWDPLYIVDHYPRTMFTAVDLERCYAFDPRRFAHINADFETFSKPHVTDTAEGILGFCMPWWEGREENLLPLCLPRLAAVAAASWNREGENDFPGFLKRYARWLDAYQRISGYQLPPFPSAPPQTQSDNVAYRARVHVSAGAHQPHFGPERLTNGITERFDHFLGFPTHPEPLEILLELQEPAPISSIVVHERAVGKSYELYNLAISSDGKTWHPAGNTTADARGDDAFVRFPVNREEPIAWIRIQTRGCHGLTFPAFSRISEVQAFAR